LNEWAFLLVRIVHLAGLASWELARLGGFGGAGEFVRANAFEVNDWHDSCFL